MTSPPSCRASRSSVDGPIHLAAARRGRGRSSCRSRRSARPASRRRSLGSSWTVEAKLDRPGFDSAIEAPVRIVQPVALLRAGVVHVGEFALYPEAGAAVDDLTAAIELDPLPLCAGAPFRGTVILRPAGPRELQEIRAEIRVHVKATVGERQGRDVTAWAAILVPALEFARRAPPRLRGTSSATRPADDRDRATAGARRRST